MTMTKNCPHGDYLALCSKCSIDRYAYQSESLGDATASVVEKWIVGDKRRFGPTKEYFILIPRHYFMDEDWYFRLGDKEAVPQSRLFDTPQEAALAAIKLFDEEIRWAGVQRKQMQDWYDREEAERIRKETDERRAKEARDE